MENVLDAIRASVAADATPEAKAAGIAACRAVLAALGASAGEPLAAPRPIDVGPTAQALAALIRSTPPDQLLDLLIAKLRTAVPGDAKPAAVHKVSIPLVRIPSR
jgi:hypothetical protein